jgi:cupin fold WbuC family metalloprotein
MKQFLLLLRKNGILMIHIDKEMIETLAEQARSANRKRKNLNFHTVSADPMHRMLHAMEPETYVQPHKHENPDKREAFIILKGRVAAVQYTDTGDVSDFIILDPATECFGVEFTPRTWHNLIVIAPGTIVYEVKDGPWDPADDKFFATWAPAEGDNGCEEYKGKILKAIGVESPGLQVPGSGLQVD